MLSLAGFMVGFVLAGDGGRLLASREPVGEAAPSETPQAQSPSIPGEDVAGSDVPGLSRYPGSVRIEYMKEDQGEMIWTETEYLTDANLSQVREFYRDSFRSEDWAVNDVAFAQNAWVFFIVKDEREVFVEIRPRGNIVEVDIEQTEPNRADRNTGGENGDQNNANDEPNQQSQPAPPAPEPPAPESAPPAPAPATPAPAPPVDGDDYDDYEDDYED